MKRDALLRTALVGVVVAGAIYLAWLALVVRVEQYDGLVYLDNTKRLLQLPTARFEHIRPPLLSLVMVAPVGLAALGAPGNAAYFVLPHLAAVLVSLLSAWAVGLVLRRSVSRALALAGVALFVGTRLFLRYGAFAMADILSAGLVAAVMVAYLRLWSDATTRPPWRDYVGCGIWLGLALLAKLPLGLLVPALALAELFFALHHRRWERRRWFGLATAAAIGGLVFLGVQLLIFTWLYGLDSVEAMVDSAKYDFSPRSVSNRLAMSSVGGSPWDYATLAWHTFSPAVVVSGAIGLGVALRRREARDLPFLAGLVVLGGTIVLLISHREARYLLPLAPIWLYFVARAIEAAAALAQRWWAERRALAVVLGGLGVAGVLSVGFSAATQVRLDQDAFYTTDVQRQTLAALTAARGPHGRLRWFGGLATLHPGRRADLRGDDYYDIFHIDNESLQYFTSEPITPLQRLAELEDGDAVLKAPEVFYRSWNLPPAGAPPPVIWHARVLGPPAEGIGAASEWRSPDGGLAMRVEREEGRIVVYPLGTLGKWYVYARCEDTTMVGGEEVELQAGRPVVLGAAPPSGARLTGILLMAVAGRGPRS